MWAKQNPNRTFLICCILLAISGCSEPGAFGTTASRNCFSEFQGQTYKYELLAYGNRTADRAGETIRSTLNAKLEASKKTNGEILQVSSEFLRRLDQLDEDNERGRAELGECFGVGFYGKSASKKYSEASNHILRARGIVNEYKDQAIAWNNEKSAHAAALHTWKSTNERYLKKDVGGTRLEITEIKGDMVTIAVLNKTDSTFLRPVNRRVFAALSLGQPVSVATGATLTDDFGNALHVSDISPQYYNNPNEQGIRPGESMVFTLSFSDTPIRKSKSFRLAIGARALGQSKAVVFEIPSDVYFSCPTQPLGNK